MQVSGSSAELNGHGRGEVLPEVEMVSDGRPAPGRLNGHTIVPTQDNGHAFVPAQDNAHVLVPSQEIGHAFVPAQDKGPEGRALHSALRDELTQRRKERLSVSVVIPTLNEAGNIATVLRQLRRFDDIVLVDGFSNDGTVEIAREARPGITVVQRPPRGKGDALRAGFAEARGDVIVIMDADGSMDPGEVDVFMSVMDLGFDLVKGSRLACGGGSHDLTTVRMLGNAALCRLANMLFRTRWTDLCYGYLAFRRSCLPRLALTANGFEIESQILGHAALAGLKIAEVPSIEMPRISGDSHLNARRDGTRILKAMLSARFAPHARRSAVALRPLAPPD